MSTAVAGPWEQYGNDQAPWEKYAEPDKTKETLEEVPDVNKQAKEQNVIKPEPSGLKAAKGQFDQGSAAEIAAGQAHGGDYSGAAHTVLGAAGGALAAPGAVVAGPMETVLGTGLGSVGGFGAKKVAEHYGANPSQANLAGDAGAIVTGALGAGLGSKVGTPSESNVSLVRGVGHDLANKYVGPRLANAILPETPPAPIVQNLNESPNYPAIQAARSLARRNAMQSLRPPEPSPLAGMASTAPAEVGALPQRAILPTGGETPMTTGRSARIVPRGEAAPVEQGRIVSPNSPAPHVEGSYWSFNQAALRDAVMKGDRDAAIVYKQRFGKLPEGAGYLTDVGQKPNRGLYRSEK